MIRWLFLVLGVLAALSLPALAVNPNEVLSDPNLEARARSITAQLRCLVCQNESIDDSNADLAHDLRVLVRRHLVAGDSDEAVVTFVRQRYGDYVLLKPPVKPTTYLLWFGPALLLIGAGGASFWALHRRQRSVAPPAPLTESEQRELTRLLDGRGGA
jgi:cytochrome c-type biogenesis protein CcmH